jgi:DNA repair protein RecN (Recombination protein N)
MLLELRVENLLLIERAELRLAPGLNVLTGETGAGKTVLAHALDLLLGGRSRPGIVRPGAGEAYVEGVFDLPDSLREQIGERLPADAAEIVLARRVGADGRTRAYLNGRSANVGELRDLGGDLLAFYGQHEHRKLTLAGAQLEILDDLCGPDQEQRLRDAARAFAETTRLTGELEALRELSGARERELDLLEFELAEIDAAALTEEEHSELLAARERLRRLDALRAGAGAGADALAPDSPQEPGTAQLMASAVSRLSDLTGVDPSLDTLTERLRGLLIESHDLAGEFRGYCEQAEAAEAGHGQELGIEQVEERLQMIERLMRKHGGSVHDVLEHGARARARRDELAGAEVAFARTDLDLGAARAELETHVTALRLARRSAAPRLAGAVRKQLASLAMGDATFEVILTERDPGPSGGDAVELMIAPNPGVPAGPLREIASGGELSRVMLAIMSVATAASPERTLVFDEVDAGIGGHTARTVGARLRELAAGRQVLCITHLPQIASLGDRHFTIVKDTSADPTRAEVVQLGEPDVVSELVRMLGADAADSTARRHARDLRRAA